MICRRGCPTAHVPRVNRLTLSQTRSGCCVTSCTATSVHATCHRASVPCHEASVPCCVLSAMRPQASHALLAKQKSNDQKMLYHFSLKHVPYITRRLLQVAFQDSVTHEAGEKGATIKFSQTTGTVVAQGPSHNHPAVVPLDALPANGVKLCAFDEARYHLTHHCLIKHAHTSSGRYSPTPTTGHHRTSPH